MLLVPIVYATVSFSQIQAAQYAVAAGSHAVARSYALHGSDKNAETIVQLALEDQGVKVDRNLMKVTVTCPDSCVGPQIVTAKVGYSVAILGLGWTGSTQVALESTGYSFRGAMQSHE